MTPAYALHAVAQRAVLAEFGIDPIAVRLEAEAENLTYKAVDARGDAFGLRVHRPGYRTKAEIASERDFVNDLSQSVGVVPRPVPCKSGEWTCAIPNLSQQIVICTVSRWIPGRPLAEILTHMPFQEQSRHLRSLGKTMGTLHKFAAHWNAPGQFDRPILDARGLLRDVLASGVVSEHPKLTGVEAATLAEMRLELYGLLDSLGKDQDSFGVIHADLHPGNALFHSGSLSVIDFDDMSTGWYLYDVAVTSESLARVGGPSARNAFYEGYACEFPLPPKASYWEEIFTLARLLFLLDWLSNHPDRPGFEAVRDKALRFHGWLG